MQKKHFMDRGGWRLGPWADEHDAIVGELHGFRVLAARNPTSGAWRVYVGVEPGHPWHEVDHLHEWADWGLPYWGDRALVAPHADVGSSLWWVGLAPGDSIRVFHAGYPKAVFRSTPVFEGRAAYLTESEAVELLEALVQEAIAAEKGAAA